MQVWEDCPAVVRASVTVGGDEPIVLVADHVADTLFEREAVTWAVERIIADRPGFYVLFV